MSLKEELRIAHMLGEGGEKKRVPYISHPRQLRMLARSKNTGMRFSVARSRYTPIEVLETLAKDSVWTVRMAVAWHEKCTIKLLHMFLKDPEKPVKEAALRQLQQRKEASSCPHHNSQSRSNPWTRSSNS